MWFAYLLIILFGLSAGLSMGLVDQPRKPITAGSAMLNVLVDIALIIGIIHFFIAK